MDINESRISRDLTGADGATASVFDTWIDDRPAICKLVLVGTYTPRKCGIATFTSDVEEQLRLHRPEISTEVYALDDPRRGLRYAADIRTISVDDRQAYRDAAARINASGADVVWLQHEYGIFGGEDGAMVLDFVDRLALPLILTLHTVLERPNKSQHAILDRLIARASRIMVMSRHSIGLLQSVYNVPAERIVLIEHGAPDRPFGNAGQAKARLGLTGKHVLMTFGLIGPGKGLETAIEALPRIVARQPDTVYRIVGATHPELLAREGEAYREKLIALADRLGVRDHVVWEDRFLDTTELLEQIEGCDIYLTPYPNLQQSTSGTLSYAVALGRVVVSSPYVHARELLADGVGVLVDPLDPAGLAESVIALLEDPDSLATMQRRAWERGRATIWPHFASASAALVESVLPASRKLTATFVMPSTNAVFAMSDGTGMLQHAIGPVGDRRHGYCLDDNARALMLMHRLDSDDACRWALTYAAFIQHAWNDDTRTFRNFMNFDRTWCEEAGSEDSNGRAIWALGDCAARACDHGLRHWAADLFDKVLPDIARFDSPRTLAFLIFGCAERLAADPEHVGARETLAQAAARLQWLLDVSRRPAWTWFEAVLGYDNPRLSEALLRAGEALGRHDLISDGLSSLRWIADRQRAANGHFRPVGSDSLGRGELPPLPFDQQPLEAQAAIDAAVAAHRVSGDPAWVAQARAAWAWFIGGNDRGVALADPETGRCFDGLTPRGVNQNSGAESILAYQMSYHAMLALIPRKVNLPGVARLGRESAERIEPIAYT